MRIQRYKFCGKISIYNKSLISFFIIKIIFFQNLTENNKKRKIKIKVWSNSEIETRVQGPKLKYVIGRVQGYSCNLKL